jgi:hypothetical protein
MMTKVGSPDDDPGRTRRYAIAIPSAILITALCVLLGRSHAPDRTVADQPLEATVVLEKAPPTPPPTPKPKPKPTPAPVPVAHVTLAPVTLRVAPVVAPHVLPPGGAHAAPKLIALVTKPKTFALPNAGGSTGASAASGTGSGSGSGDAQGSGSSSSGDAVNADAPCGVVDLVPYESPDHNGSAILEHVQATVTFPDGHKQTEPFPYRFVYPDADPDPWSARNVRNPNFVAVVLPPPPGANVSRYSELIRYILDHTLQNGRTVLQECPRLR